MKREVAQSLVKSVKQDYDLIAEDFSKSRCKPWYEFLIYKELTAPGDKVLDIGCGNGRLLKSLHDLGIDYYGVDLSPKILEVARDTFKNGNFVNWEGEKDTVNVRTSYEFVEGNFNKLDFENESVDKVLSVAAFHHIPSKKMRKDAIKEISRVLKNGGVFAFSVWNLFQPRWRNLIWQSLKPSNLKKYSFGDVFVKWSDTGVERYYHAFNPYEIRALFRNSGLVIVDEMYVTKKGVSKNWWSCENMVFICKKGVADE